MGLPLLPLILASSYGFDGLLALPLLATATTMALRSPLWRQRLPVMPSSSPPRVDGDKKVLY